MRLFLKRHAAEKGRVAMVRRVMEKHDVTGSPDKDPAFGSELSLRGRL